MTGNVNENWKRFKQSFELYSLAIGLQNEERKIALLLTVAGRAALDVYNTFTFTEHEEGKYDVVMKKFEDYCTPKKNETYERYVFRNRLQKESESIEQYVTDLRLKSQSCNFEGLRDSMIRDQIVIGVQDNKVRMQLLKESKLTLDKAVEICQASECTKAQLKTFNSKDSETVEVDAVQRAKPKATLHARKRDANPGQQQQQRQQQQREQREIGNCERCGMQHAPKQCPAFGKECRKCGGKNHYARTCFSRKVQAVQRKSDSEEESFFVDAIEGEMSASSNEWIACLDVNGTEVPLKLDTGAQVNILPMKDFKRLKNKPKVRDKKINLRTYDDTPIPTKGVCRVTLSSKGQKVNALFVLVDGNRQAILGLKTCDQLGLIKRVSVIDTDKVKTPENTEATTHRATHTDWVKEYREVFKGIGRLPGIHKIRLKENAEPVIHPARKVPVALRQRLREKIDSLIAEGVVRKIEEPTEWVNSLVIVEKPNGDLRLCIDPKDLNKAIQREHYRLPTKSDITSTMSGASYFTKLDASSGFYQIVLDEESSKLCTFNTPFGRHCFLRLPFGISSAPEVFHRTVQQLFDGIEGVGVFIDDVVVWGKTKTEHDERLARVLKRAQKSGLKLNKSKCQFGVQEITYLGEKLSGAGVQPDPEKVRAIAELPVPQDKNDLQRALGLVNYLGKFIPNLSANTRALRSLLETNTMWQWMAEHAKEWAWLRSSLTQEPVLKFYDQDKPLKVSTDASKAGLGAVLLQKHDTEWYPVAYASRTMTSAERNYAQIEKETLGAVFGCEKFHEYVYGRSVILETDHKPLIAISQKPLGDAPPRIQRLMLRLQKYDLTFEFTPGKHLVVADALSRASLHNTNSTTEEVVQIHIDAIRVHMPVSDAKWAEIVKETQKDVKLKRVMKNIHRPGKVKLDKPYQHFKGELSVLDGVLLKGTKIVIPTSMRAEMVKLVHEGHLGIEKCKRRARGVMYWPKMHKDIEAYVQRCETCQRHRYQQAKEPMRPHEKPTEPWSKVGMDLFQLKGKDYLVVMDYYSNYPEFVGLSDTTAERVVAHTKTMFARHGIPMTVVSDNGPQYTSQCFRDFANTYGFKHVTSSPLYPQSNGLAEKGVQIVKRILKKAADNAEDPHLAILNYRASPLENGLSPAEMLMNRKLRTRLPSTTLQMEKRDVRRDEQRQTELYNRTARPLRPLAREDIVRVRGDGEWGPLAKVVKETTPRSYQVITEHGKTMRRNRRHLLKVPQTKMRITDSDTNDMPIPSQTEQTEMADNQNSETEQNEQIEVTQGRSSQREIVRPKRLIEEM